MTYSTSEGELEAIILASGPTNVPVILPGQEGQIVAPSIQMFILHGESAQESLGAPGSNLVRYVGQIVFTIYTEGGEGPKVAQDYAETIMTAYRNVKTASVHCKIPYIQQKPQDGKFYSLNVVVPFHRDAFQA